MRLGKPPLKGKFPMVGLLESIYRTVAEDIDRDRSERRGHGFAAGTALNAFGFSPRRSADEEDLRTSRHCRHRGR